METYRLKNIVIIVLVFVDLFLLFLFGTNIYEKKSSNNALIAETVNLLANNGIAITRDIIPDNTIPDTLTLVRSETDELSISKYVLGDSLNCTDEGGGIYLYENENGSAVFRNNGSFEITLADDSAPIAEPLQYAAAFCAKYGYSKPTEAPGTALTITAVEEIEKIAVYNCNLYFKFDGDRLSSVTGSYLPLPTITPEVSEGISAVSALVKLVDYCNREGKICNEISDIRSAYTLQSTTSSPMRLVPVYMITTDSFACAVNRIDESIEQVY